MRSIWPRSIFLRLIIIIVIFCVALNIAVFLGIRRVAVPPPSAQRLMKEATSQYFIGLATQIGDPPKTNLARSIANDKGVDLRITWLGNEFSTRPDLPIVPVAAFDQSQQSESFRHRGPPRVFGPFQIGNAVYTFYGPPFGFMSPNPSAIVVLLSLMSGMLGLVYLAIRALMSPLRELTSGVDAIGHGKLEHRIKPSSSKELGLLAIAIIDMTSRIQKMISAKEHLLIDVSHELRSPLTRMKLATELLTDGARKASLIRDISEMEMMVTELLENARITHSPHSINLQKCDFVAIIHQHLDLYLEESARLTFSTSSIEIYGYFDKAQILTMLRNLVENALKYSRNSVRKDVEITIEEFENELRLSVRDYGVGIPTGEVPFIFEPFYRVDKSRSKNTGGYGLGLSICKRIVDAHGGNIEVISDGDQSGTNVIVTLPKRLN